MTDEGISGFLWCIGLGLLAWFLFAHQSFDRARYGAEHVMTRPIDCDFLTSPIGTKHCHYTRRTEQDHGATWVFWDKDYDD